MNLVAKAVDHDLSAARSCPVMGVRGHACLAPPNTFYNLQMPAQPRQLTLDPHERKLACDLSEGHNHDETHDHF